MTTTNPPHSFAAAPQRPGTVRRLLGQVRQLGRWLRPPVDVVYHPGYELPLSGLAFDPRRGERILTFLEEEKLVRPEEVLAPRPISWRDLRRVHTDAYLESLRDPAVVSAISGVPLGPVEADRVLALARRMAGGTLLATRRALAEKRIAVNLGGGFHHARADRGAGFCMLHDIAVAVRTLRAEGFAGRVLVVDLDLHDGDGSRLLFADDPAVHTYSIHNRHWAPPGDGEDTAIELPGEVDDGTLLDIVRGTLPPLVARFAPDLCFYLAGADPAADDALGNWKLTADGMLARDVLVVEQLRPPGSNRPLVVVMGGGYGPHTWRYSARFVGWLLARRRVEPPATEEITIRTYRRVARGLSAASLGGTGDGDGVVDDWGLTPEDLGAVSGAPADNRFLGFYSEQGVELALERTGFFERLRKLGYPEPAVELDLGSSNGHTVRVWGDVERRDLLLVELRARRDRALVPGLELLSIEWLLQQNPRGRFTAERPPLPGQKHPGLGMLADTMALLVLVCDRLGLDGIAFVPAHWHLAAQARRLLHFLDPVHEARFRALAQLLRDLPLDEASRRIADGEVLDRTSHRPFLWPPMPMVLPVSDALAAKVTGPEYEAAVVAAKPFHFALRGGGSTESATPQATPRS